MSRSLYVNMPTKSVAKAREFYSSMGFAINEEFSNEQNVMVIIDKNSMLMLVEPDFYKQNVPGREIADTTKVSEVSLAIQVDSRAEVDKLFDAGIAAGGSQVGDVVEEPEIGMYSRGLTDLDGHKLDLLHMGS